MLSSNNSVNNLVRASARTFVCKCGYPENDHPFRHEYSPLVCVEKSALGISLDANSYPEETRKKCSFSGCNSLPLVHAAADLKHPYTPMEVKYRKINYAVPIQTMCSKPDCETTLEKHRTVNTHSFTLSLEVKNKKDTDVLCVFHPDDEDIKISLSSS